MQISRHLLWKKFTRPLMELGRLKLSFSIVFSVLIIYFESLSPLGNACNLRGYLMIFRLLASCLCLVAFLENLLVDCLNSQDIADIIHIGWWAGHRNSCHTLWYRKDYRVCFQSSWMCHELSILLYWKASLVSVCND